LWVEEGVVSRPARRKFSQPTQQFKTKPPLKIQNRKDLPQIVQSPQLKKKAFFLNEEKKKLKKKHRK
jgi:hypothetical protein